MPVLFLCGQLRTTIYETEKQLLTEQGSVPLSFEFEVKVCQLPDFNGEKPL